MANIRGKSDYDKRNLLNAARFLGGGDLTAIEIPEMLGEDGKPSVALLKRPSAGRVLSIRNAPETGGEREHFLFKLIAECVVDEDGKRIIPVDQEAQLPELISAVVWTRLANALMDLANAASLDAGTAGNAPSGTPEDAPKPVLEVPQAPVLTDGSASPTSSLSASESGT